MVVDSYNCTLFLEYHNCLRLVWHQTWDIHFGNNPPTAWEDHQDSKDLQKFQWSSCKTIDHTKTMFSQNKTNFFIKTQYINSLIWCNGSPGHINITLWFLKDKDQPVHVQTTLHHPTRPLCQPQPWRLPGWEEGH